MMDERSALLYAKLNSFNSLVSKTKSFIRWSLQQVDRPYVACSFGKDSSVMLHLVLEAKPNIQIKMLAKAETHLIDDYDDVIKWWETKFSCEVERITYKGWMEGGTKKGIANNMKADDNDAFFVGIRREESVARRITLSKFGKFYRMKDGKVRIAPLSIWSVDDIAAYLVSRELPILRAYQREGFEARTTTSIPSKFPHEAISRLKDADVSAYNKLVSTFPDAKYFT
jgi:3'-phosphoadenosine 5'-phosphosulfate sulfotransferase (PAPS reductase)/FAD synthetase